VAQQITAFGLGLVYTLPATSPVRPSDGSESCAQWLTGGQRPPAPDGRPSGQASSRAQITQIRKFADLPEAV